MFDVIVVGAGPSGSTVAYLCAKSGYKTLLLDKKFPRRKICGGGISPKSISLLEKLKFNLKDVPKNWFSKIKLIASDSFVELSLPTKGYVTDRLYFDSVLANNAINAGAIFYSSARCVDIIWNNGFVNGVVIRRNKNLETLNGKITVAADGFSSTVMSKLKLLNRNPENIAIGMREIYSDVKNVSEDMLEIYFNSYAPEGYAWIFPLNNKANIGIGGIVTKYLQRNLSLYEAFNWFVNRPFVKEKIENAEIFEKSW